MWNNLLWGNLLRHDLLCLGTASFRAVSTKSLPCYGILMTLQEKWEQRSWLGVACFLKSRMLCSNKHGCITVRVASNEWKGIVCMCLNHKPPLSQSPWNFGTKPFHDLAFLTPSIRWVAGEQTQLSPTPGDLIISYFRRLATSLHLPQKDGQTAPKV